MSTVVEFNAETGGSVERPMTAEEQKQADNDRAAAEARDQAAAASDPDADLIGAIAAATTLAQLKDALIGKGRAVAVAGRGKDAG